MSQVRYAKICKNEEKEIPWSEIVKGYEYEKGEFVILTQEDFEKANVKKTQTLEIIDFTNEKEIDPIYYDKPYYLEPEKSANKAYTLLREALKASKKVGIAKYVLHNREHIALIKAYKNVLILNQLRYSSEILSSEKIEVIEKEKVSEKELEFAIKLIDQLTQPFNPDEYRDTYVEEIKKVIEKKAKGQQVEVKGKVSRPSTKVFDLMTLLKESLKKQPKPAKKRVSPKKKTNKRSIA